MPYCRRLRRLPHDIVAWRGLAWAGESRQEGGRHLEGFTALRVPPSLLPSIELALFSWDEGLIQAGFQFLLAAIWVGLAEPPLHAVHACVEPGHRVGSRRHS